MNADNGGGAFGPLWALAANAVAVGKEVWAAFIAPSAVAYFAWRRWKGERDDARAKDRRTEEQKRTDEWHAKLTRADAQVQAHVTWLTDRAERAEKRADAADARADAAEREQRRLELHVERYEHALANARQVADDARAEQGKPRVEWKPVLRPKLPGDPP